MQRQIQDKRRQYNTIQRHDNNHQHKTRQYKVNDKDKVEDTFKTRHDDTRQEHATILRQMQRQIQDNTRQYKTIQYKDQDKAGVKDKCKTIQDNAIQYKDTTKTNQTI